jgi:hypothetical protein
VIKVVKGQGKEDFALQIIARLKSYRADQTEGSIRFRRVEKKKYVAEDRIKSGP